VEENTTDEIEIMRIAVTPMGHRVGVVKKQFLLDFS
jgi:hypothetical protein